MGEARPAAARPPDKYFGASFGVLYAFLGQVRQMQPSDWPAPSAFFRFFFKSQPSHWPAPRQLPKKVREHEMLVVFRNLRIGSLYG